MTLSLSASRKYKHSRPGSMFRTEREFVRWLQRRTPRRVPAVRLGIGDDAALVALRPGREIILTTDLSVEGVHFLRSIHPPRAVGHRALARSVSDVAAMGGIPRYALLSLTISRSTPREWVEGFYAGVFALAERSAVTVVGGDTAVVPGRISIDVVVVGEVERRRAILRSGARPGDQLFVSGRLGLSALGLQCLRATASTGRLVQGALRWAGTRTPVGAAVRSHLYPEPRLSLGRFLSEKRLASALIDLSDGLSTDLARLCEASGVGARVWMERIPAPKATGAVGFPLTGTAPLSLALHGGEDYELLFSVPARKARHIPPYFRGTPLHWIGEIRRSKGILLTSPEGREVPLKPAGYDHFSNR